MKRIHSFECRRAGNRHVATFVLFLAGLFCVPTDVGWAAELEVTAPPESFFEKVRPRDREAARQFYAKYLDIDGIPVAASAEVDDEALRRTHEIVSHMLAGRPDVAAEMVSQDMYLVIIGKDQLYTDMPEYHNNPNPDFMNERVRGTGGNPTSFGEENLLSLLIDRYDDESIAVHEFLHTIDRALGSVDPDWRDRKVAVYRNALDKGLYKDAYAASNPAEYWAEIGQAYFDCNRVNNWNHGPVGTREQLKVYDPEGYDLVRTIFRLSPEQDWRYSWLEELPNVIAPPERFAVDPYYTKFTWAREFPVIGRKASDEALLKANDTVRKLFAYRHDILKALLAEDVMLVVLGPGESIADLPEYSQWQATGGVDALARYLEYSPRTPLVVVAEENVLGDPSQPLVGDNQVIRTLAKALYAVTAHRPVDPDWDDRGREVQQYELRVTRLDERFGKQVENLYNEAMSSKRWQGTSAVHGPADYWAAGVLAYFDALGQDSAPNDAPHPINTRESLREYDPKLFDLVHETMAYDGRVDWRFRPDAR